MFKKNSRYCFQNPKLEQLNTGSQQKLCGRPDFAQKLAEHVENWNDANRIHEMEEDACQNNAWKKNRSNIAPVSL